VPYREENLLVGPDFLWEWSDPRPLNGVGVAVTLGDQGIGYFMPAGAPIGTLPSVNRRLSRRGLYINQLVFLVESRWLHPRPVTCFEDSFEKTAAFRLRVEIPGFADGEYFVDQKTFLPLRLVWDHSDVKMKDYVVAGGIRFPSRVNFYQVYFRYQFQINPEYDENIFKGPPSLPVDPDGWKPKRKN